jgi:dCTP deaminase
MTFKCVADTPISPLISPYISSSVKHLDVTDETLATVLVKCPSFGSSSYGYDIRPASVWKRMRHVPGGIVSTIAETGPNILKPEDYSENIEAPYIDIPSMGAVLGVSMERICMPNNVTAVCMAKSTLARLFLEAAVTPLEAGWSGYITLEFFNKSPNTIRLWGGIGAMQLCFHVSNERCLVSYEDRGGKYQNQPAIPVAGAF